MNGENSALGNRFSLYSKPMPPYESDIAWAAGLFEGEGCWTIRRHKYNGYGPYPGAQLHMTDLDVVERFRDIMGVGNIYTRKNQGKKDSHVWNVQGMDKTGIVANKIGPYMGKRRLARMREVLTEKEGD